MIRMEFLKGIPEKLYTPHPSPVGDTFTARGKAEWGAASNE